MYYPKLTFASSIIEGIFLFGILCFSNKFYGLDPYILLEVSKSCIWKKSKYLSEQHPFRLYFFCKRVYKVVLFQRSANSVWLLFFKMSFQPLRTTVHYWNFSVRLFVFGLLSLAYGYQGKLSIRNTILVLDFLHCISNP